MPARFVICCLLAWRPVASPRYRAEFVSAIDAERKTKDRERYRRAGQVQERISEVAHHMDHLGTGQKY
jgi:hypothetical protein